VTTLFLADLHLSPDTPALNARFQAFLRAHAGQVEALYILGDLFEFWLGDDDDRPFTRDCLSWLAAFARQTPLYRYTKPSLTATATPPVRASGATLPSPRSR